MEQQDIIRGYQNEIEECKEIIKRNQNEIKRINKTLSKEYEFYLGFWGEITNDKLVERELGIEKRDFWFNTEEERIRFKAKLAAVAKKYKVIIAFKEKEGRQVRFRTVAKMVMVLPDRREFPYEYDFGYAYGPESARFMFEDGNYACDCNRSLFISKEHPEIKEWPCGDEIRLKNFMVALEE